MVLFLFVIMLVHQRTVVRTQGVPAPVGHRAPASLPVFLVPFLYILGTEKFPTSRSDPDAFRMVGAKVVGNTQAVAWSSTATTSLPFEVASDLPPGRHDRRRRPGQALGGEGGLMTITINHFLIVSLPALLDRVLRGARAPQLPDGPDVGRADAERRQPEPRSRSPAAVST
mgnify:CR=1 FL=1